MEIKEDFEKISVDHLSSRYTHCMIDLETVGTTPGCVILQIGYAFIVDGEVVESGAIGINMSDAVSNGLILEPEALKFWLEQDELVRSEAFSGQYELKEALEKFEMILNKWGYGLQLWGNAASFDLKILEKAYQITGMETPWSYRNENCYRTLKNLLPGAEFVRTGNHHDAEADAVSQANHLITMLKEIGKL